MHEWDKAGDRITDKPVLSRLKRPKMSYLRVVREERRNSRLKKLSGLSVAGIFSDQGTAPMKESAEALQ